MINAAHVVMYSGDAEADRGFFRDVLGLVSVDAGGGWLIFALPPAELGIHPADEKSWPGSGALQGHHQLYLMCDDIESTVRELKGKGVEFTQPVNDAG
jgi:catechol 2,3-dioxygenase-like lactoylglutathione lyase family enzyme